MSAGLLTLMQWLSPAFPVGGYAYSHGLETAISDGSVSDAATLQRWIAAVLAEGSGRNDAILLVLAMDPGADLGGLSNLAQALAASRERLAETMEQGAAFVRTVNALTGSGLAETALPVAVGAAARSLDLPPAQVAAFYLQAFAGNLVQAAVRFLPLGQTEGQRVLAALQPLVLDLAEQAARSGPGDLGGGTLGADLAAMKHETLEVRIFRT